MSYQTALTGNTIGVVLTGSTAAAAAFAGAINAVLTIGAIRIVLTLTIRKPAGVVQAARARCLTCAVSIHFAIDTATDRAAFGNIAVTDAAAVISAGSFWQR